MDASVERECSALGCLFQQIIADMKNGTPLWEDLISKATKLHTCLKTVIVAISAYLEAFQKIADAATNTRGATRDIGTALTRICLRHKAVENKVKSLTSAIMDCLVIPLQEKLEDWKKSLVYLDKEHAKEYKKARTELKKKSIDTLRLQKKKVRKTLQQQQIYGTLPHNVGHGMTNAHSSICDAELGKLLESSAAMVQEKLSTLEETERKAVRAALLEERGRFCQFARFLKPVLDEEISMIMEMTHLQEVADQLQKQAASPNHLPAASERVIEDVKGRDPSQQWALATPPSSPSLSLGSRKSSVCSISSLTSSSSGSCKSHPSPSAGHPSCAWQRTISSQQPFGGMVTLRYRRSTTSGSRDSGFTSLQENLCTKAVFRKVSNAIPQNENSQKHCTTSTWPDLQQDSSNTDINKQNQNAVNERPHTISSAYEKGHQRPALSVYTFQAPEQNSSCQSQPASPTTAAHVQQGNNTLKMQQRKSSSGSIYKEKPPIPNRCSSLERPAPPVRRDSDPNNQQRSDHMQGKIKLPIPTHIAKELTPHHLLQQPMYVNMHELASLAAIKAQEMLPPPPPPPSTEDISVPIAATSTGQSKGEDIPKSGTDVVTDNLISTGIHLHKASSQQTAFMNLNATRRINTEVDSNKVMHQNDELENLPPPPPFLLEGSPPPNLQGSPVTQRRSMSVSETVRTLTELKHTPASPSLIRRKIAAQTHSQGQAQVFAPGSADEKALVKSANSSTVLQMACCAMERATNQQILKRSSNSNSPIRRSSLGGNESGHNYSGPGGVTQSFIAALSAKFASSISYGSGDSDGTYSCGNSPRLTRKSSGTFEQQNYSHKNNKTSIGFLESLNARLSKSQNTQNRNNSGNNMSTKSASVRRLMANRVPMLDPLQVRDSLMDQIRRGTALRKTTGPINDRSAPKIY